MPNSAATQGVLPYNPVSSFYKQTFGEKVFKIPVALAGDCPNRRGLKGMKTCIFCDEHGSFAYPQNQKLQLQEQLKKHKVKVADRFNAKKFLVYFQAYTTTFTQVNRLTDAIESVLEDPDIVGIVIGTRPDCLSGKLLDKFSEISERILLSVELGVQSFDDKQLEWMRRGHDSQSSLQAVLKIQKHCPKVIVGIHLMFGWPGESQEDIIRSAKICNSINLQNVKLHNLHVLKNTPLADLYETGEFQPIEWDDYAHFVGVFLDHLSPEIFIHRLVALASRWDELVAPQWTRHKMTNYQRMLNSLKEGGHFQGRLYGSEGARSVMPSGRCLLENL